MYKDPKVQQESLSFFKTLKKQICMCCVCIERKYFSPASFHLNGHVQFLKTQKADLQSRTKVLRQILQSILLTANLVWLN